jgi:hypothetical protein
VLGLRRQGAQLGGAAAGGGGVVRGKHLAGVHQQAQALNCNHQLLGLAVCVLDLRQQVTGTGAMQISTEQSLWRARNGCVHMPTIGEAVGRQGRGQEAGGLAKQVVTHAGRLSPALRGAAHRVLPADGVIAADGSQVPGPVIGPQHPHLAPAQRVLPQAGGGIHFHEQLALRALLLEQLEARQQV